MPLVQTCVISASSSRRGAQFRLTAPCNPLLTAQDDIRVVADTQSHVQVPRADVAQQK